MVQNMISPIRGPHTAHQVNAPHDRAGGGVLEIAWRTFDLVLYMLENDATFTGYPTASTVRDRTRALVAIKVLGETDRATCEAIVIHVGMTEMLDWWSETFGARVPRPTAISMIKAMASEALYRIIEEHYIDIEIGLGTEFGPTSYWVENEEDEEEEEEEVEDEFATTIMRSNQWRIECEQSQAEFLESIRNRVY